jgi:hypothetical protein
MAFIRKKRSGLCQETRDWLAVLSKSGPHDVSEDVLYYSVVKSVRVNGNPRHIHLASLGTNPTIADRIAEIERNLNEFAWNCGRGEREIEKLRAIQAETGLP